MALWFCVDHTPEDMEIPLINLQRWYGGDEKERRQLAAEVGAACRNVGFIALSGFKPDTEEAMQSILGRSQQLFGSTFEEKMMYSKRKYWNGFATHNKNAAGYRVAPVTQYRGYFPLLHGEMSYKEGFDFGSSGIMWPTPPNDSNQDPETEGNVWPDESLSPGFHQIVETYFHAMEETGRILLSLFSMDLTGSDSNAFDEYFKRSSSTLRILRYPPRTEASYVGIPDSMRFLSCSEHSDSGCVTLLLQDDMGGLQIKPQGADEWIDVQPRPNTIVVNLGDCIHRWTNGLYVATPHRVLSNSGRTRTSSAHSDAKEMRSRYSVPFFFEPSYDTRIDPLPQCITENRPQAFDGLNYGEFLKEKVKQFAEFRDDVQQTMVDDVGAEIST